jgi:hypothetical protein
VVAGSVEGCTCIVRLCVEAIWQLRPVPQNAMQCVKSVRTELISDFKKMFAYFLNNIDMLGELGWNTLECKISNL